MNERKNKPLLKKLNNIIRKDSFLSWIKFLVIILIILVVISLTFNYLPFLNKYENFVIISDSMTPTIKVGDMVIINTDYNIDELEVSDIIAFRMDIGGDSSQEVIVHYLASITNDGLGNYTILTRREGVTEPADYDDWTLTQDNLVGTYAFKIPIIGKLILFLGSAFGKIIAIVDIIVIFLVIDYFIQEKESKKIKENNDNNNDSNKEN